MRKSAFASLGGGWFSDVALGGGHGWLIGGFETPAIKVRVLAWDGVDVSLNGAPTLMQILDEPMIEGTGYSRICCWSGVVWAAYHDGRVGHLWNLTSGRHEVLEPCQNNNPICFGFGFVAWQGAANESWPVSRMNLATGEVARNVRQGVGTGLSRILVDGSVVTVDEDRFALPGATQPCFAGDLAVGEGQSGALWKLGDKGGTVWPGEDTFTPKCAVDGNLVAVATCGGKGGIRLFCGSRDELLTLTGDAKPPDPPPVDPPKPPDPPKEPTVSYPFPDSYDPLPKLEAVRERFPTPLGEQHGKFLVACCKAVGFGAGLMNKSGGTIITLANGKTVSQDYMVFPNLAVQDFITDGEGAAKVQWGPAEQGNPGQYLDVSDLFEGGVVNPPPGNPPPVDDKLEARVKALEARFQVQDAIDATIRSDVGMLASKVYDLEHRQPASDEAIARAMQGVAHAGDGVTLTANLPLVGAVRIKGKIDG